MFLVYISYSNSQYIWKPNTLKWTQHVLFFKQSSMGHVGHEGILSVGGGQSAWDHETNGALHDVYGDPMWDPLLSQGFLVFP